MGWRFGIGSIFAEMTCTPRSGDAPAMLAGSAASLAFAIYGIG